MSTESREQAVRAYQAARQRAWAAARAERAGPVIRAAEIVSQVAQLPASSFLGLSQSYDNVRARHLTFWIASKRFGMLGCDVALGCGVTEGAVSRGLAGIFALIDRGRLSLPDDPRGAATVLWEASCQVETRRNPRLVS